MSELMCVLLVGMGATAFMDLWALGRRRLFGIPTPNYALVGRWLAHMPRGRFHHDAIAHASRVRNELLVGWVAHYLIGIAFAGVLAAVTGLEWLSEPTLAPALIVGISTVVAPFFVMQPAMGNGVAASRTPRPASARVQSLMTHTVFGLGLYLAGWVISLVRTRFIDPLF